MNDIPYKVYMGKIIMCRALTMSTVIIALYLCMATTCTCICTGVSKNSRSSAVYVHNESGLNWPDLFLEQAIYHLQYKYPVMPFAMVIYATLLNYLAGPQLHVAYVTYS